MLGAGATGVITAERGGARVMMAAFGAAAVMGFGGCAVALITGLIASTELVVLAMYSASLRVFRTGSAEPSVFLQHPISHRLNNIARRKRNERQTGAMVTLLGSSKRL